MDRRTFLKDVGIASAAMSFGMVPTRLLAAVDTGQTANVNWVDPSLQTIVQASSEAPSRPGGYSPRWLTGDYLHRGWESDRQTRGAWIEIDFPEPRPVSELWILVQPLPRDIIGQEPYMLAYSRAALRTNPRKIRVSVSGGQQIVFNLRQADFFEILPFPATYKTASIRILIEDVWSKPGAVETGLGKIRAFPLHHTASFEIDAWPMYDVREGRPVQTATINIINPDRDIAGAELIVMHNGGRVMEVPLAAIPARSVTRQDVWIPSPPEDSTMEFAIRASGAAFGPSRSLNVPAYRSFFENGTFSIECTCHNDLGWLDTQEKTADYRSAEIILPAMKLLHEFPGFRYSMECTTYLMEFLERHPEQRQAMTALMKEKRFEWGASYVECQDVSIGPEKLVRQFYFGRRWLKKTFPGVDTRFYVQTDPAEMTLQLPQILKRAGVRYYIQGRMPFGFYRWEAPDGSSIMTYAYQYDSPSWLLDPKGNKGWLSYAEGRSSYYAEHDLPREFIYDYTSDYLPPQPALPPYVDEQNRAMQRFAEYWASHGRNIHPPVMRFATLESFLDEFTKHPLDITTLKGDWPFSWAYYDGPGHREAILDGREAHNRLLMAERLFAGLSLDSGFSDYPAEEFNAAWRANCWPDHGWGGNQGVITDAVYAASYKKSLNLANKVLESAGSKLLQRAARKPSDQRFLVVFNPLNWQRTDVVQGTTQIPSGWQGVTLRNSEGKEVACELLPSQDGNAQITFVAEQVPSLGYSTYSLEPSSSAASVVPVAGRSVENDFFKITFGDGGIKSLYDKRLQWEVLQTDKFDGGEVIQFTAPGLAWGGTENVTMENYDQTSRHAFPFTAFNRGAIQTTAIREAKFDHFLLREHFRLYHSLDRLDIDLEIVDWDGQPSRELRAVFPINLDAARFSYEVPFGTVEMGKDELDFTLLPKDSRTAYDPHISGGDHPLPFREAINWIDASSRQYQSNGCLSAADCTVHLFRDETAEPVSYPVLQHVLLSTRKSQGWNPVYWFTQKGTHRYRMAVLPHHGDWRLRYREAVGFNYPLMMFAGSGEGTPGTAPPDASFLRLEPNNLCLTALKKSEEGDAVVVRFYEAEGFQTPASIRCSKPIRAAWRANLIEEDEAPIQPTPDGRLNLPVGAWEIVTLKLTF